MGVITPDGATYGLVSQTLTATPSGDMENNFASPNHVGDNIYHCDSVPRIPGANDQERRERMYCQRLSRISIITTVRTVHVCIHRPLCELIYKDLCARTDFPSLTTSQLVDKQLPIIIGLTAPNEIGYKAYVTAC